MLTLPRGQSLLDPFPILMATTAPTAQLNSGDTAWMLTSTARASPVAAA